MIDLEVFLSMKSIRKPLLVKVILEADSVLQSSFKMGKKTTQKKKPGIGNLIQLVIYTSHF